ncbi:MAG TPA: metallophosphoesterase family protein [Candidatus Sulfotelmatobacter sp.]|nr:metallophosphoesterase family protein [Candidatus Sulfotelmatobacter sp.]
MRIAALYDIHGNPVALDAVLAEVAREAPDLIVVGGDVVAGPMPVETLDRLEALGDRVQFIRGNTEREVDAAHRGALDPNRPWAKRMRWVAEQLSPERRRGLMEWPLTREYRVDGLGAVLFCHATPRSDEEILTRVSADARFEDALRGISAPVVIGGHTHVQYDRRVSGRRMVNAGSVGMPYEDSPGARWAMLGPEVRLMRTPYDLERAGERIRSTGYPDAAEFVREYLIEPFGAQRASEFFESLALRAG